MSRKKIPKWMLSLTDDEFHALADRITRWKISRELDALEHELRRRFERDYLRGLWEQEKARVEKGE